MRCGLLDGVEGADNDVQSEPGSENPASPVMTHEEEDSADDREKTEEKDQNCAGIGSVAAQLGCVKHQADKAGGDEEDREHPDGDGAGSHGGGKL